MMTIGERRLGDVVVRSRRQERVVDADDDEIVEIEGVSQAQRLMVHRYPREGS